MIDETQRQKLKYRLTNLFFEQRKNLKMSQAVASEALGISEKTYQRRESAGAGLDDIFNVLEMFRVFNFSTIEIIDALGLPPLKMSEMKELYQNEKLLKNIEESGICNYMHDHCADMDDITIANLLNILSSENLKRCQYDENPPV